MLFEPMYQSAIWRPLCDDFLFQQLRFPPCFLILWWLVWRYESRFQIMLWIEYEHLEQNTLDNMETSLVSEPIAWNIFRTFSGRHRYTCSRYSCWAPPSPATYVRVHSLRLPKFVWALSLFKVWVSWWKWLKWGIALDIQCLVSGEGLLEFTHFFFSWARCFSCIQTPSLRKQSTNGE